MYGKAGHQPIIIAVKSILSSKLWLRFFWIADSLLMIWLSSFGLSV